MWFTRYFVILFIKFLTLHGIHTSVIRDQGDNQGLYNSSDFVVNLKKNNFKEIFNSERSWLVEFYNTWCGHCVQFAPIWKEVAKSLLPWKNIIAIAALDCAVEEHYPICKEYDIMKTPTLKFFSLNSKSDNLGLELKKHNSEISIIENIVNQLIKEQQEGRGNIWPNLIPLRVTDLSSSWNSLPLDIQYQFIIFEKNDSLLGAQVILDLNKIHSIRIRRVLSSNEPLVLTNKVTKFPTVIVFHRHEPQKVLKLISETREGITGVIKEFLKTKNVFFDSNENQKLDIETKDNRTLDTKLTIIEKIDDKVYQPDLENTLKYSLGHEIPIQNINGEKFAALKNYLDMLVNYFPIKTSSLEKFLIGLQTFVNNNNHFTGEKFKQIVQDLEVQTLPEHLKAQKWVNCNNFNHYPCGLWTMFHTLTVESASKNVNSVDSSTVLKTIYAYVKNFFGCEECSKHFLEMANRKKLFNQRDGDESILWLWKAHNEVNKRLSLQDTNNIMRKKIQYPSYQNCPLCRESENGSWIEKEVLKFLKAKYGKKSIVYNNENIDHPNETNLDGLRPDSVQKTLALKSLEVPVKTDDSNVKRVYNTSGWNLTFFDISIYLVLYIFSATILVLICIKFAVKRSPKRKFSFNKFFGSV